MRNQKMEKEMKQGEKVDKPEKGRLYVNETVEQQTDRREEGTRVV